MSELIHLDGTRGEGGGQILRSALCLSLCTGRPFRIDGIRARRRKPGLLRQHLTAVQAATRIGEAEVEGDAMGSSSLTFRPRAIRAGAYRLAVGTAGSTMLVLQTVLPALLRADGPSTLELSGGTHNPFAPPFGFLLGAFLPQLARMGAQVQAELIRPGFYPAGGGIARVTVEPCGALEPLELLERGEIVARRARALVANLPREIGERENAVVRRKLGWSESETEVVEVEDSVGPGNLLSLELESEHVTEVFTGFGERKRRAEKVAGMAVQEVQRYLGANVPVGEHLADQLLIPMALAGGGRFRSVPASLHTRTNAEVIETFLPVRIDVVNEGRVCTVEVRGCASGV